MFLCSKTQDIVVKTDGRVIRPRDLMPSNQIRALASFLRLNPEIHLEESIAFGLVNLCQAKLYWGRLTKGEIKYGKLEI
jgi:hypothetical protein